MQSCLPRSRKGFFSVGFTLSDVIAGILLVLLIVVFSVSFGLTVEQKRIAIVSKLDELKEEKAMLTLLRAPFDREMSVADAMIQRCAGMLEREVLVERVRSLRLYPRFQVKVSCKNEEFFIREDVCPGGITISYDPHCGGVKHAQGYYETGSKCTKFKEITLPGVDEAPIKVEFCKGGSV